MMFKFILSFTCIIAVITFTFLSVMEGLNSKRCNIRWKDYPHKFEGIVGGCLVDITKKGVYVPSKNILISGEN